MSNVKYQEFGPLYGKASKGRVKIWFCSVKQALKSEAIISIIHGLKDCKQQTSVRKVLSGKNIGRANETTIFEQAIIEATSEYNKKLDKGYATSVKAIQSAKETKLPMLALKFADRKHDVIWPAYVQPKLNGVRCLVERQGDEIIFHSRGGKTFQTLKHLVPDFLDMLKDGEWADGELYNHQEISFQELVSLIKNEKNPKWDELEKYVRFWNYDVCLPIPFRERMKKLKRGKYITPVRTLLVHDEADVLGYHEEFNRDGFEGTMIRSGGDEPYTYQYRSPSLLKLKNFMDEDFKIVGVREGRGKDEGKAIFTCELPNGGTFDVRTKGTDDARTKQWDDRKKLIGKMLTVCFQCYSDDRVPVFPVGLAIRDYE